MSVIVSRKLYRKLIKIDSLMAEAEKTGPHMARFYMVDIEENSDISSCEIIEKDKNEFILYRNLSEIKTYSSLIKKLYNISNYIDSKNIEFDMDNPSDDLEKRLLKLQRRKIMKISDWGSFWYSNMFRRETYGDLLSNVTEAKIYMIDPDKYGANYRDARIIKMGFRFIREFILYPRMDQIDNRDAFIERLEKIANYKVASGGPKSLDINDAELLNLTYECRCKGDDDPVYDVDSFLRYNRTEGKNGHICAKNGSCVYKDIFDEYLEEKAEQARLEAEKAEQARLEAEKVEQARLAAEKAEQSRLEAEKAEQARLEAEKAEQARLEAEKAEQARLEAEKQNSETVKTEQVSSVDKKKKTSKFNDVVLTSNMIGNMIEKGIYVYYVSTYEGHIRTGERECFIKKYDEKAKCYYYIRLSQANNVESLAKSIRETTEKEELTNLLKHLIGGIRSVYSINSIEKCRLDKQLYSLEDSCFMDFDSFKNIELKLSLDNNRTYTVDLFRKTPKVISKYLFEDLKRRQGAIFTKKDLKGSFLKVPKFAKYTGELTGNKMKEIDFGSIFGILGDISCENLLTIEFGSNIECIKNNAFSSCEKINKIRVPDRKTMNFVMGQFIDRSNFSKIEFYIDDKKVNLNVDIDKDDVEIEFLEGKLVIPDGISILDKETFDKIIEKLGIAKSEIKEIDFNQVVEIREGSMNDLENIKRIDLRDVANIEYNTFVTGRLQKIECSGKFNLDIANEEDDDGANSVFSKKCFGGLFNECDRLSKRNELTEKNIKKAKARLVNIFGLNFSKNSLYSLKEVLFSDYECEEDSEEEVEEEEED